MKVTDKPRWKITVTAVICLLGLLSVAGGSFAAYTSQDYKRGVARNRDNEFVRFTSNYLQTCTEGTLAKDYARRTIQFNKTEEEISIPIEIFNYVNGNTSLVSQKDIAYTITITAEGGEIKSVSDGKNTETPVNGSYTKDNILIGRSTASHKYSVTISGTDLDKIKITVTAVPTNLAVTGKQFLAAVIVPCTEVVTNTFTYKGVFVDASSETTPKDYDGFNYEVSISSGSAYAVLRWEKKIVEIDRFFLEKIGKTEEEIATALSSGEVSFQMDQNQGTMDYLIPFYIVDQKQILDSSDSWATLNQYITFTAKEITKAE